MPTPASDIVAHGVPPGKGADRENPGVAAQGGQTPASMHKRIHRKAC